MSITDLKIAKYLVEKLQEADEDTLFIQMTEIPAYNYVVVNVNEINYALQRYHGCFIRVMTNGTLVVSQYSKEANTKV